MKQYCRYCTHAFLQDDDYIYCEAKDEFKEGKEIKRLNHCKNFDFCEIDVLDADAIKKYKPRTFKKKESKEKFVQCSFYDTEVKNEQKL